MLGWMKHKLESRLPGEISVTSDMQIAPHLAESKEELKNLLLKVKESEKTGLKLNIQKTKIMASGPRFTQGKWKIVSPYKNLYVNIYGGFTHNCQKLKTGTQISISL